MALDAERTQRFLAQASTLLASSLDYDTTLASLARLAVPNLADWCAVDMVEPDHSVRQVAVAHVDPLKVALARELGQRYPFDPSANHGVPVVLRSGRPELITHIDDDLLASVTPDEALLAILHELGLRSSMVVPLVARGRILGAITLVSAESGRHFTAHDLALAEDLAGRAALAVDNANLYRDAQESAAKLAAVLAQMADGVAIADQQGRVTYVNDASRRIMGVTALDYDPSLLVDMYRLKTVEGERYNYDNLPLARALRGETVVDAAWRMARPDGTEIVAEGTAAPIVGADGTITGAVMTYRDVTAQHELERQKADFLLAASHDLKNPLTTIKGLAQMLQRQVRADATEGSRMVQGLARIDASATAMSGLINDLLDTTRIQMGLPLGLEVRQVELVGLVREVALEYAAATEHHRIHVDSEVRLLHGNWDEGRLRRAFGNLLSNAIKYSPGGGDITITVAREAPDERPEVVVTVADQGIGIPEHDQAHVFDRFRRASNTLGRVPGTGLGLASVRQVVEGHGGQVEVSSTEGVGSTFTIRLPLVTEPGAADQRRSDDEPIQPG